MIVKTTSSGDAELGICRATVFKITAKVAISSATGKAMIPLNELPKAITRPRMAELNKLIPIPVATKGSSVPGKTNAVIGMMSMRVAIKPATKPATIQKRAYLFAVYP